MSTAVFARPQASLPSPLLEPKRNRNHSSVSTVRPTPSSQSKSSTTSSITLSDEANHSNNNNNATTTTVVLPAVASQTIPRRTIAAPPLLVEESTRNDQQMDQNDEPSVSHQHPTTTRCSSPYMAALLNHESTTTTNTNTNRNTNANANTVGTTNDSTATSDASICDWSVISITTPDNTQQQKHLRSSPPNDDNHGGSKADDTSKGEQATNEDTIGSTSSIGMTAITEQLSMEEETITPVDNTLAETNNPTPLLQTDEQENDPELEGELGLVVEDGAAVTTTNDSTAIVPYNPIKNLNIKDTTNNNSSWPWGDSSSSSITSSDNTTSHKGLVNLGNTCYLNSALQMILGVEDFVDEIIALYQDSLLCDVEEDIETNEDTVHTTYAADTTNTTDTAEEMEEEQTNSNSTIQTSTECNATSVTQQTSKRTKYPLRDALAEFFLSMNCAHRNDQTKSNTVATDPSKLKNIVDELTPQFVGFRQQDSHEFLSTLLDLLHDEMKQPTTTTTTNSDSKEQYVLVGDKGPQVTMDHNLEVCSADGDNNNTTIPSVEQDNVDNSNDGDTTNDEEMSTTNDEWGIGKEVPSVQNMTMDRGSCKTITTIMPNKSLDDFIVVDEMESDSIDQEEVSIDEVKQKKARTESVVIEQPSLYKVSSYAELNVQDISVLLHGNEHVGKLAAAPQSLLPTTRSWASIAAGDDNTANINMKGKLIGGRIAPPKDELVEQSMELSLPHPSDTETPNDVAVAMVEEDENDVATPSSAPHDNSAASCATPVDKYFTTEIRTHLICDSCQFSRSHQETFRHLSIEIAPSENDETSNATCAQHHDRTVQDGLRQFFAPEKRELKCEKCFCESAMQTTEIIRLPQALIVHLKRFIMDISPCFSHVSFKKNKDAVEFEEMLTLDPTDNLYGALGEYLAVDAKYPEQLCGECNKHDCHHWCKVDHNASATAEEDDGEIYIHEENGGDKYKIRSVVHHIGSSADCGHYTADVRKQAHNTKKREWNRFNDSSVSTLTPESALGESANKNAYMIMYVYEQPECDNSNN